MRFGVLDIENSQDGSVTDIGACLDDSEPILWEGHRSWDAWFAWATDTGVSRWYAHNGGGWDWLSLLYHSCTDPGDWRFEDAITANCVGTRPICVRFAGLELCDSWCLTQCSLDQFAQQMGTSPKQKTDKLPWDMTRDERRSYLHDDCVALRDAVNRFLQLLNTEGYTSKRPPLTIAGAAWNIWKQNYAPTSYERLEHDGDLFCRQGYKGGRVEVFKPGTHDRVRVYDVNSMYPYVMVEQCYPVGQGTNVSDFVDYDGAYRVESVIDPAGVLQSPAEDGDVLYTPEIRRIKETGGEVSIYQGVIFERSEPIFRDYVNHYYPLKAEGGPLGFVAKMLLNHLYGKLGSRPISSSMESMTEDRLAGLLLKGYDVSPLTVASDQMDWWVVDRHTPWRREHVAVAALVTSYARCHLHRGIDEDTIYTDTDSFHTLGTMTCSKALGGVKLEYGPAEGVYLGRKCYALKNPDGEEKIRLKGISQKTLSTPFNFKDVVKCVQNPRLLTSLRPATLKETLSGIHPCSMVSTAEGGRARERKRTLRVTA